MSSETRLATVDQSGGRLAPVQPQPGPGAPAPPRPPAREPGFDIGVAVRAVRRYWPLIAVLGAAVGAGTAAAVWKFLPPGRQSACVVLHISDVQPIPWQVTPEGSIPAALYRQRQQQAVTSRKVLETALANPAVADLPIAGRPNRVDILERRIKVDFKLGQEFMRVTVEADTPEESLALVTAVKDAYLSEVVNKERHLWEDSVARRVKLLEELEATFQRNQAELAKKLEPFKLKLADAPFIPHLRRSAEEKLQQKESELRQVQARIRTLEIEGRETGREDKVSVPDAAVDEEIDRDPQVATLRAATVAAEKELTDKAGPAGTDSNLPAVVRLREAVAAARKAEAAYRQTARPKARARLEERERDKRRVDAEFRRRELGRYRDLETALTGDIEQAKADAIRLSGASFEIESILQTVTRQEKQIGDGRDEIARQRREVEVAPARVTEHEPPRVVPIDEFRRLKYAGVAGVAGLAAVLAGFVGLERLRNRVSDPGQMAGLTLPVLGTLPNLGPGRPAPAARGPDWAVAVEAIDTVRTMLLHAVGPSGPQVVLVSSPAPAEGKTTLSGFLAESLVRGGYRTLLIDGDLRRPTAHSRYRTPTGPGVAEILRGEETAVLACCYRVEELGLWVLPAGRDSAAASELLPKGGWQWLVQQAREAFDVVVVDSAPLLAVVDPLVMAQACDGVVLAVMRDVSRIHLLADAANRLRTLDIPILGCVVHRAYRPPTGGYYYYANRPAPGRHRPPAPPPAAG